LAKRGSPLGDNSLILRVKASWHGGCDSVRIERYTRAAIVETSNELGSR
jgi:hypothetical protein